MLEFSHASCPAQAGVQGPLSSGLLALWVLGDQSPLESTANGAAPHIMAGGQESQQSVD
jgi:hypothetical protein